MVARRHPSNGFPPFTTNEGGRRSLITRVKSERNKGAARGGRRQSAENAPRCTRSGMFPFSVAGVMVTE